jgi:hypothetical protein
MFIGESLSEYTNSDSALPAPFSSLNDALGTFVLLHIPALAGRLLYVAPFLLGSPEASELITFSDPVLGGNL